VEIISNANEEFYLFFIKMPVLSGIGAFNDWKTMTVSKDLCWTDLSWLRSCDFGSHSNPRASRKVTKISESKKTKRRCCLSPFDRRTASKIRSENKPRVYWSEIYFRISIHSFTEKCQLIPAYQLILRIFAFGFSQRFRNISHSFMENDLLVV
jgi:hypothetical protein